MILPSIKRGIVISLHAGRIKEFIENWALITQDPWVLQTVQGFQLPLVGQPTQATVPPQLQLSLAQQDLISTEIQTMIEKRAISLVQPDQRGFISQIFLVPKKDGGHRPVVNLKALNKVHSRGPFQNGRFSHGEGSSENRGLVGKIRSEGCLFSGTNRPQSPEVSSVSMAGQSIPISLSAIRTVLCPSYLYEVNETSGGIPEGEGNQTDHISGRLTNTLQLPRHVDQPARTDQGFVSDVGSPHQQQKVPIGTITGDCIFGPSNFDHYNASVITQGKSDSDPTGGQAIAFQNRSVSTEASSLCGHDNSSKTGSPGGSTVSSPLTSSDKQSSAPGIILGGSEAELPSNGRDINRGLTGINLVDARNAESQQGSFAREFTRSSDRVRCISLGLGSNLERSGIEDRWSVVDQRTRDAHQLSGTTSSIPGNSDICQGEAKH